MTHPTLNQTVLTMMAFHDSQLDKSGVPYFNHPLRVMLRLGEDADEAEKHAALLHDVIEDCGVTAEILLDLGYSEEVVQMVALVSKSESTTYRQYIFDIAGSGNVGAMRIKLADMIDNSDPIRVGLIEDDNLRRSVTDMIHTRYRSAIHFLKDSLGEQAEGIIEEEMEIHVELKGEILDAL